MVEVFSAHSSDGSSILLKKQLLAFMQIVAARSNHELPFV